MRSLINAKPTTGPLGPVVAWMDTSIRWLCALVLWATFIAMLAPTFANAVLRYTTNASLTWSVEIVQLTFPWFIMAGGVLAAQHHRHIGVELFVRLLPGAWPRHIAIIVQSLVWFASLAVIYVYLGFGQFSGGMEFAAGDVAFTSLGIAQSWSYLALLIGYMLLGLTALTTIYRLVVDGMQASQHDITS